MEKAGLLRQLSEEMASKAWQPEFTPRKLHEDEGRKQIRQHCVFDLYVSALPQYKEISNRKDKSIGHFSYFLVRMEK